MADALTLAGPATRFILRGRPAAQATAGAAFGLTLPTEPCRAASAGERHALWLGPDEWLLLAPPEEADALGAALEAAMAGTPHALVEVSQRQQALALDGANGARLLAAGCPLDLDLAAFPVGMCTRTVLAKAEIVLWRTGAETFRIEVWRSFVDYARSFLEAAQADLA